MNILGTIFTPLCLGVGVLAIFSSQTKWRTTFYAVGGWALTLVIGVGAEFALLAIGALSPPFEGLDTVTSALRSLMFLLFAVFHSKVAERYRQDNRPRLFSGVVLVLIGVLLIWDAITMDSTVTTFGQFATQQNILILGALATLIGVILFASSGQKAVVTGRESSEDARDTRTCPLCAELVKSAAIICKHCGKDIPPPTAAPTPAR
jgi:hypothetical protein